MSKRTRNLYRWKERTDDGRKRFIEAQLFGAEWRLTSRYEDEEEWTEHSPALLDDLIELEKKVFNKYQRKHNAWDQVLGVRKLIADQRNALSTPAAEARKAPKARSVYRSKRHQDQDR